MLINGNFEFWGKKKKRKILKTHPEKLQLTIGQIENIQAQASKNGEISSI